MWMWVPKELLLWNCIKHLLWDYREPAEGSWSALWAHSYSAMICNYCRTPILSTWPIAPGVCLAPLGLKDLLMSTRLHLQHQASGFWIREESQRLSLLYLWWTEKWYFVELPLILQHPWLIQSASERVAWAPIPEKYWRVSQAGWTRALTLISRTTVLYTSYVPLDKSSEM